MTPFRKIAIGALALTSAVGGAAAVSALTPASAASSTVTAASTAATGSTVAATSGSGSSTPAPSTGAAATPPPAGGGRAPAGPHTANGITEVVLTGDTATKVEAAVKAAYPDASIQRMETDAEGATYEAHITKADGSDATVKLDASFTVTSTVAGHG